MDEAMELIRMVPETLSDDAIDCFQKKFQDMEVPVRLLDAKYEFECYQFYFVCFIFLLEIFLIF